MQNQQAIENKLRDLEHKLLYVINSTSSADVLTYYSLKYQIKLLKWILE